MDLSILIPLLISVVGAGVSVYTARQQRRKIDAEASTIETQGNTAIVGTAITLVEPLRKEIETLRSELLDERANRKAETHILKEENRELRQKNKELQAAYNLLAQERASDRARIKRLEERLDTGELTPPPHQIPRPNWQEPDPIDEPPNE